MKVFVTGADGMLGTNTVMELLKRGYQVTALVHSSSKSQTLQNLAITRLEGDILNKAELLEQLAGHDFVIHIAANTAVWPSRNKLLRAVNIDGTRNLMEAAMHNGIKRFVHVGTANSFQPGTKEKPGDETGSYDGGQYQNDYLDSKYEAQCLLLEAHREKAFPVIIVNPTFMLGKYDSLPTSGRLVLSYVQGRMPGYSKGAKNYVAAGDVAIALVNALSMGKTGECYIAGNENLTYLEFFNKVGEVTGVQHKLRFIPFPLILAGGRVVEFLASLSGKTPRLSYGMARLSGIEQYYSAQKAIRELNMPQTPINLAIKESFDWMTHNQVEI
jgi:dihydroflavonol-4-reductase